MSRPNPIALRAALLVGGLLLAQFAAAAPPHGRMHPEQRDRLRQELLEQRRAERAQAREQRASAPADGGAAAPGESPRRDEAWSAPQYRPPWRHGGWRQDGYGGQTPPGQTERQRLSPEERSELRTLLRERHREMRERHPGWRPDDGR